MKVENSRVMFPVGAPAVELLVADTVPLMVRLMEVMLMVPPAPPVPAPFAEIVPVMLTVLALMNILPALVLVTALALMIPCRSRRVVVMLILLGRLVVVPVAYCGLPLSVPLIRSWLAVILIDGTVITGALLPWFP